MHADLLLVYALPFFFAAMIAELVWVRQRPVVGQRGYDARDTATSMTMGFGNLALLFGYKLVMVAVWAAVYAVTPLRLGSYGWPSWLALLLLEDQCYYWYHRSSHRVRLLWTGHVTHHSSQFYNASTAVRQQWVVPTTFPFWIPLAVLGFSPAQILVAQSWSLIYQFFLHTERVGVLPRPVEWVMNTPSQHRVHHGSQQLYLDRNFAGIFSVWDRAYGTYRAETEPVVYGLTKNIASHHPVTVGFHELGSWWWDVRRTVRPSFSDRRRDRLRAVLGHTFGPPGWQPPVAVVAPLASEGRAPVAA